MVGVLAGRPRSWVCVVYQKALVWVLVVRSRSALGRLRGLTQVVVGRPDLVLLDEIAPMVADMQLDEPSGMRVEAVFVG